MYRKQIDTALNKDIIHMTDSLKPTLLKKLYLLADTLLLYTVDTDKLLIKLNE